MRWPYPRPLLHLLDMSYPEITHTNALRPPLRLQPLQRLPHLLPRRRTPTRRMYQEQIHIPVLPINLRHTLQTFLVRSIRTAATAQDLRRQEEG